VSRCWKVNGNGGTLYRMQVQFLFSSSMIFCAKNIFKIIKIF
jgi:hypothetical protein